MHPINPYGQRVDATVLVIALLYVLLTNLTKRFGLGCKGFVSHVPGYFICGLASGPVEQISIAVQLLAIAKFPYPGIRRFHCLRNAIQKLAYELRLLPVAFDIKAAVGIEWQQTREKLPVYIILPLHIGAIADAHRPIVQITGKR